MSNTAEKMDFDDKDVNKATILFVDDEKNILSSLKRLFRGSGYQVYTAESGADGLKIIEQHNIDLVISDMRMPKMDGAEFLAKVKEYNSEIVRILLTGYADMESTVDAINKGEIFKYVNKPWVDSDLLLSVKIGLERKRMKAEQDRLRKLTQRQNKELKSFNERLEKKVKERTLDLKKAMKKLEAANVVLKGSFMSSVQMFSSLLELRGGKRMIGHSRKVAEHAREIALAMGMDQEEAQTILFAGLLHDIGEIVLPDSLLNRPTQAMNTDEKREFAKHVVTGQGALMNLATFEEVGTIVRSHHELYDGSGYPDGLKGDEIPVGARIICLVSDYYALQEGGMMSHRLPASEAREYIHRNKIKRYDPKVVTIFMAPYQDQTKTVQTGSNEMDVPTDKLKPGMLLAKDLLSPEGMLLIPNGTKLDNPLIDRIRNFEKSINRSMKVCILLEKFDSAKDVKDFMVRKR
ncbi:MAG: response regulator [Gammaproteobacteria bacterium]|nr:response regulator [Gammaproteobacteria bacterium]